MVIMALTAFTASGAFTAVTALAARSTFTSHYDKVLLRDEGVSDEILT